MKKTSKRLAKKVAKKVEASNVEVGKALNKIKSEVYVRPSGIISYNNCPAQFNYQYILRRKSTEGTSANLVFGTCVHLAIGNYLMATTLGREYDPVKGFQEAWLKAIGAELVVLNKTMNYLDLFRIGTRFSEDFPKVWEESGFQVFCDEAGPVLERRWKANLGDNVILDGQLDLLAVTPDGELALIDIKCPAGTTSEEFTRNAIQLSYYQKLIEENLGLKVSKVGYWELIKRKVPQQKFSKKTGKPLKLVGSGPLVSPEPLIVDARGDLQMKQDLDLARSTGEKIRRKEFYKNSGMAYNTPCDMCEHVASCQKDSGIVVPEEAAELEKVKVIEIQPCKGKDEAA